MHIELLQATRYPTFRIRICLAGAEGPFCRVLLGHAFSFALNVVQVKAFVEAQDKQHLVSLEITTPSPAESVHLSW